VSLEKLRLLVDEESVKAAAEDGLRGSGVRRVSEPSPGRSCDGPSGLLTRTGLDWPAKYPSVIAALAKLNVRTAYLDGELCGGDEAGLPSFAHTQAATDGESGARLVYYAFDLLHLDGQDVSGLPLVERKGLLEPLVANKLGLQFNGHDNLGRKPREISADAGYCGEDNLLALATRKIHAYVATGRAKHPAEAKVGGEMTQKMRQKLKRAGYRSRYRLRKQIVEPVFGQIVDFR
jgi:hypothetical protein